MPTCKQCNKIFPTREKIDGKVVYLHKRSYCLECSPYMENNGYNLRKSRSQFSKNGKICPCCKKQQKKYYKNNVCSTCRMFHGRYITRNKIKIENGGKCKKCGIDDISILQFHHLDPQTKVFNLSAMYHSISYQHLVDEAKKCELLCPNCHAREHIKSKQDIIDYYKLNPEAEI